MTTTDRPIPWRHKRVGYIPTLKAYNELGLDAPDNTPDPSGDEEES